MKFVLSRKGKKRDGMKDWKTCLSYWRKRRETHTKKDNNAMMSQGCLNPISLPSHERGFLKSTSLIPIVIVITII